MGLEHKAGELAAEDDLGPAVGLVEPDLGQRVFAVHEVDTPVAVEVIAVAGETMAGHLSTPSTLDAITTGDGEDAFVEIVEAYNAGRSLEGIEGVWFKDKSGQIIKNRERKSTKSLDAYPWPDRSRTRYQEYYLPMTQRLVAERFASDIEHFGYEF